jgi:preprotein translocase subunit SecA
MRRFAGDKIKKLMDWAKFDEDTPIEHRMVTKAIRNTQEKVEGYHFDIRKHLLEYDDVLSKHREMIYDERRKLLSGADLKANIQDMIDAELQSLIDAHLPKEGEWDIDGLLTGAKAIIPLPQGFDEQALSQMSWEEIEGQLLQQAETLYERREGELGSQNMRILERLVMLRAIDRLWIEHLTAMENMRQGIGLESVGQRNPLVSYKRLAHGMLEDLQTAIQHDIVHTIYNASIVKRTPPPRETVAAGVRSAKNKKKIGRNDPCPCGSGKKYKHCCGRNV